MTVGLGPPSTQKNSTPGAALHALPEVPHSREIVMPTTEAARLEVATQVTALQKELGNTRDEVADTLAELGVTGRPDSSNRCPIANYLRDRLPDVRDIDVSAEEITIDFETYIDVTDPVAGFISDFDQGYYSQLVAPRWLTAGRNVPADGAR
jgi:hypothetical protein